MLWNFIPSFCYTVARHARVGQKSGDVNDAELPYLEGTVTPIVTCVTKISRTGQLISRLCLQLVNVHQIFVVVVVVILLLFPTATPPAWTCHTTFSVE